ncbi:MAG: hypothetical protein IKT27_00905, partial [Clostridia bacterium]|nr:hypothetical protein [Clostridia bacterium]
QLNAIRGVARATLIGATNVARLGVIHSQTKSANGKAGRLEPPVIGRLASPIRCNTPATACGCQCLPGGFPRRGVGE